MLSIHAYNMGLSPKFASTPQEVPTNQVEVTEAQYQRFRKKVNQGQCWKDHWWKHPRTSKESDRGRIDTKKSMAQTHSLPDLQNRVCTYSLAHVDPIELTDDGRHQLGFHILTHPLLEPKLASTFDCCRDLDHQDEMCEPEDEIGDPEDEIPGPETEIGDPEANCDTREELLFFRYSQNVSKQLETWHNTGRLPHLSTWYDNFKWTAWFTGEVRVVEGRTWPYYRPTSDDDLGCYQGPKRRTNTGWSPDGEGERGSDGRSESGQREERDTQYEGDERSARDVPRGEGIFDRDESHDGVSDGGSDRSFGCELPDERGERYVDLLDGMIVKTEWITDGERDGGSNDSHDSGARDPRDERSQSDGEAAAESHRSFDGERDAFSDGGSESGRREPQDRRDGQEHESGSESEWTIDSEREGGSECPYGSRRRVEREEGEDHGEEEGQGGEVVTYSDWSPDGGDSDGGRGRSFRYGRADQEAGIVNHGSMTVYESVQNTDEGADRRSKLEPSVFIVDKHGFLDGQKHYPDFENNTYILSGFMWETEKGMLDGLREMQRRSQRPGQPSDLRMVHKRMGDGGDEADSRRTESFAEAVRTRDSRDQEENVEFHDRAPSLNNCSSEGRNP